MKISKADIGKPAYDLITGFKGVITGAAFYITGCDQYCVTAKSKDEGTKAQSLWFDINRLEIEHDDENEKVVLETENEKGAMSPPDKF